MTDYSAASTEASPYWLHYVEKAINTLMHVLRLLCHTYPPRVFVPIRRNPVNRFRSYISILFFTRGRIPD